MSANIPPWSGNDVGPAPEWWQFVVVFLAIALLTAIVITVIELTS